MGLTLVIGIIILGLVFLFVELFLIPGVAFIGILGIIISGAGVYLAYDQHGVVTGNIVLVSTLVMLIGMLVTGLKRISQLRWSDKDSIDVKVNLMESTVQPGDQGVAFNTLRPNGTALFSGQRVEVFSIGEYIEKDTPVVVTKVTHDRVYVKPIKENN
jgi:membrane-bound ClpP family serine protease